MKKEELIKNIIVFTAYLESKQNNPEIEKVIKQYRELFSDVVDKNRVMYLKYKQLISNNPIDWGESEMKMIKLLEKISNVEKSSSKYIYVNPNDIAMLKSVETEDGNFTKVALFSSHFYIYVYDKVDAILKKLKNI